MTHVGNSRIILAMAVMCLLPTAVIARTQAEVDVHKIVSETNAPPTPSGPTPRKPDGHPDLQTNA
jgi:hypothetical protein